ncbi:hypothetical protein L1987_43241 [Smallanthus sonchifolius]|uniref:Uncharacterized protein n=1 Tax=Smallanthus sonchifolius TaxID=185202 RepID=A0ACB9GL31_9ASTR|nr:hypothetical protein L1987_43241 [Smallanthus sonchifolius]
MIELYQEGGLGREMVAVQESVSDEGAGLGFRLAQKVNPQKEHPQKRWIFTVAPPPATIQKLRSSIAGDKIV